MSAISKIEWTDRTWNPIRGCSVVSPGCHNCYAMKQAHRFNFPGGAYEGLTKQTAAGPQWTGAIRVVDDAMLDPLSWGDPQRVFVNSMSDLFHESVPEQAIIDVFGVMALAHRHTFQVLTKRPERMLQFVGAGSHGIIEQFQAIQANGGVANRRVFRALDIKRRDGVGWTWPLPNVWLGVSCEDQKRADERIPLLLQTPATVRFISAEPLLGPIDLERVPLPDAYLRMVGIQGVAQPLTEKDTEPDDFRYWRRKEFKLDWVIVGGESGPKARFGDVGWVRSIVKQCGAAQVPVFVKQLGSRPHLKDPKGGDPSEWAIDLRVREFPRVAVPA